MKRCLLLAICFLSISPFGFAVDKEVIALQQNVALLQGLVRDLQRSFDERMAVIQTLLGQSSDRVNQANQAGSQLNSSMAALEKAVQASLANAGQKIDNLETGIQGTQSSLDELRARLDKISEQVAKIAAAQQNIPANPAPLNPPSGFPPVPGTSPDPNGAAVPSPDVLYNTALRDYSGGNYPLAMQEFRDYLQFFPGSTLASNAQFYIGDIFYQQGQFEKAIEEYDKAVEQYPNGNKSAAAQLKKGFALLNLNRRPEGVRELNSLIKRFPNSPEASLAKDRLTNLGPAAARPKRRPAN